MSINATAKAKVYVGSANSTINPDLTYYEADTYTQITEIEDLGSWGAQAKEITFNSLEDAYVRRRAGSIDSGKVALSAARDPLDPGQIILRENVGNRLPFNFKVTLNDAPGTSGDPTTFYFSAVILSVQNKFGKADEITMTDFELGITGAILEMPAGYVLTASPAAGALTAAVHAVAYSTTVSASGGDGSVSYAVTTGSLPAGLSLNTATGAITGTPSAVGSSSFTITATFASGGTIATAYSLVVS